MYGRRAVGRRCVGPCRSRPLLLLLLLLQLADARAVDCGLDTLADSNPPRRQWRLHALADLEVEAGGPHRSRSPPLFLSLLPLLFPFFPSFTFPHLFPTPPLPPFPFFFPLRSPVFPLPLRPP